MTPRILVRAMALGVLAALSTVETASAAELRGRVVGATAESPAVVWVEGLSAPPPTDRNTVLTHRAGRFEPGVALGFVGAKFVLRNDDDVLHNTHVYLRLAYQKTASERPLKYGATLFNVALPKAGIEVRKPIEAYHRYRDETGFIEVRCNPHPEEQAYVLVFDHPYAALTSGDGTFAIPDVPSGTHAIRAWHLGAVAERRSVTVDANGVADLVLEVE